MSNRVLVIDDDPEIRNLIRAILTLNGFSVEEAADGSIAMAKVERDEYDAIIVDLMMPAVSGYDVIREIQNRRPDASCVVVVSAASRRKIDEADMPVVRAKIQKPFDINELLEAVRNCVAR
jgi:DNA-binding response OmpR family regulator